ncbi:hypothetical protein FD755_001422 [Muntiacus reevesi]|uniref:Nucleophosmin n=1 Tax=Muntiacus reevesi TaxID=9886 RepID=A0A5J5N1X2_MUNRE|nr:hypothetical protein FD755_001422 [Muntiacus reevesi]
MEDSMDMDMSPLRPQNYLFSCELKADRDYHFKVDNDENEYQLSLRTVSLGAGAKDELHVVESEAMDYEGSPSKLKCGSGPVHISEQHLVAVEEDAESEDEEEDVKLLSISGKRSAPGSGSKFPQKKVKLAADEDDDDDEDDNDDDDDYFDDEVEEKVPVKKSVQDTPAKNAQISNQNGKDSKPSTPRSNKRSRILQKTGKTPKTPKGPSSVEDIKAKMQASIGKSGSLPKVEATFINYVKNCFRMTDQEAIQDLWQWRKSL